MQTGIEFGGTSIAPGERQRIEIPVARLPTETWLYLPVEVVHGSEPGPRLWLSAAVHGDELNGMEIIRRVLGQLVPSRLRGTVVAAPIVNVFGFINQSRYMPDRRDLNRSFPGGRRGSLASRLAHLIMTEIIIPSTYGIDLHTGSNHRTNLPQVRGDLADTETRRCAEAFGAPAMMQSGTPSGSLRQAAVRLGKTVLLYEAGEPMRFDADAIQIGVDGVLRVLSLLEMIKHRPARRAPRSLELGRSVWVRARRSGIVRLETSLGARVVEDQAVGTISDAFGEDPVQIRAPFSGVVIGHTNNPLVHQGDAILNVGEIKHARRMDGASRQERGRRP